MNVAIASPMDHLALAVPRQFTKQVAAIGAPEQLTRRTITAITFVDQFATITTNVNHEYASADEVDIQGINQVAYIGVKKIEVLTPTTFRYRVEGNPEPPTLGGTPTAVAHLWFRAATLLGKNAPRTPNTGEVFIGPNSGNDTQPLSIPINGERPLNAPTGARLNAAAFFVDVGTANDGVVALFF